MWQIVFLFFIIIMIIYLCYANYIAYKNLEIDMNIIENMIKKIIDNVKSIDDIKDDQIVRDIIVSSIASIETISKFVGGDKFLSSLVGINITKLHSRLQEDLEQL